jgi:hypothetical protein
VETLIFVGATAAAAAGAGAAVAFPVPFPSGVGVVVVVAGGGEAAAACEAEKTASPNTTSRHSDRSTIWSVLWLLDPVGWVISSPRNQFVAGSNRMLAQYDRLGRLVTFSAAIAYWLGVMRLALRATHAACAAA